PAPRAAATFALDGVNISAPHVRYAADGADARISARAELSSPEKNAIALDVDALLSGTAKTGNAEVRDLRVAFGGSGLTAQGRYDLAARTGELQVRELRLLPRDVAVLSPGKPPPLSGELRGSANARMSGDSATLSARLNGGGGRIEIDAKATLGKTPQWQVALALESVDPARVATAAPAGEVTARVEARGGELPRLDAHGVRGQIALRAHVGPARMDRVGEVRVDAQADVQGRQALV